MPQEESLTPVVTFVVLGVGTQPANNRAPDVKNHYEQMKPAHNELITDIPKGTRSLDSKPIHYVQ